jgi:hypothetical protein
VANGKREQMTRLRGECVRVLHVCHSEQGDGAVQVEPRLACVPGAETPDQLMMKMSVSEKYFCLERLWAWGWLCYHGTACPILTDMGLWGASIGIHSQDTLDMRIPWVVPARSTICKRLKPKLPVLPFLPNYILNLLCYSLASLTI